MPAQRDEADVVRDQIIADARAQRASWTRWAQRAAMVLLVTIALIALGRELAPYLLQAMP